MEGLLTSERARMIRGEVYNSRDEELLAIAHRARNLIASFGALPSTELGQRRDILVQLLGAVGEDVWIEPPFFCDYGVNLYLGSNTFVNVNCVFLDCAEIRIGNNALLGPGVQLVTPYHPLRATDRIVPVEERNSSSSPYRTRALPIQIGDNVWIGASTIVLPGVTIGNNVTIGAGSVVTSDIPSDALAFGQPCRVQRSL